MKVKSGVANRYGVAKYATVSYMLHMWITRTVEPRLLRSAKTRPVVVLNISCGCKARICFPFAGPFSRSVILKITV